MWFGDKTWKLITCLRNLLEISYLSFSFFLFHHTPSQNLFFILFLLLGTPGTFVFKLGTPGNLCFNYSVNKLQWSLFFFCCYFVFHMASQEFLNKSFCVWEEPYCFSILLGAWHSDCQSFFSFSFFCWIHFLDNNFRTP